MNYENYKNLLAQFVSFKSISTDSAYLSEIGKTVSWLQNIFKESGFVTEIKQGKNTNPVVFASYIADPSYETVLVYGHYDVQPAEKSDGWGEDPFTLIEENNKLVARGVVDNKGQILIHMHTVFTLIKETGLKYNVKFLIEGNEETANPDLGEIVKENATKFSADYVMISDGELVSNKPVIEFSLRGGFNCKIIYTTAKNNLHSGIFGGGVPNAALELNKLIASLLDTNNQVKLPGFYDDVDSIDLEVTKQNDLISTSDEIKELAGVKYLTLNPGENFYTKAGLMPTIQVTGFKSGYIGEGFSNIVPATAEVRLNFRTVNSQSYEKISKSLEEFVKTNTPDYVNYQLEFSGFHDPVKVDLSAPKVAEVRSLLKDAYGVDPINKPVGGAIPVVSDFKHYLGKETLLISLGNDDCNMHGVNENFTIDLIKKGLAFSEKFFGK